jgi:hypothetical protein
MVELPYAGKADLIGRVAGIKPYRTVSVDDSVRGEVDVQ